MVFCSLWCRIQWENWSAGRWGSGCQRENNRRRRVAGELAAGARSSRDRDLLRLGAEPVQAARTEHVAAIMRCPEPKRLGRREVRSRPIGPAYKSDKHADLRRWWCCRQSRWEWVVGRRRAEHGTESVFVCELDWRGSRTGECGRIRKAAREAESDE